MNDKKLLQDAWTIDLKDVQPSEDEFRCGCEDGNMVYEPIKCHECDKNATLFITNGNETVGYCCDHNGLGNSESEFKFDSSLRFRYLNPPTFKDKQ